MYKTSLSNVYRNEMVIYRGLPMLKSLETVWAQNNPCKRIWEVLKGYKQPVGLCHPPIDRAQVIAPSRIRRDAHSFNFIS